MHTPVSFKNIYGLFTTLNFDLLIVKSQQFFCVPKSTTVEAVYEISCLTDKVLAVVNGPACQSLTASQVFLGRADDTAQ